METFKRNAVGALINSDHNATIAYKKKRERTKELHDTINTLHTEVAELKTLLQQLLRGSHDSSK